MRSKKEKSDESRKGQEKSKSRQRKEEKGKNMFPGRMLQTSNQLTNGVAGTTTGGQLCYWKTPSWRGMLVPGGYPMKEKGRRGSSRDNNAKRLLWLRKKRPPNFGMRKKNGKGSPTRGG